MLAAKPAVIPASSKPRNAVLARCRALCGPILDRAKSSIRSKTIILTRLIKMNSKGYKILNAASHLAASTCACNLYCVSCGSVPFVLDWYKNTWLCMWQAQAHAPAQQPMQEKAVKGPYNFHTCERSPDGMQRHETWRTALAAAQRTKQATVTADAA